MTLERVSAERMECLRRIDERTKQERLEGEKRQVVFTLHGTQRMMTTARVLPSGSCGSGVQPTVHCIQLKVIYALE